MKSIDIEKKETSRQQRVSLLERMAQSILFSRLSKARSGKLIVEDQGETFVFGDTQNQAGVRATIKVNDPATYSRILYSGAMGSGEAYMHGLWSSPDLLSVIRFFLVNKPFLSNMNSSWSGVSKIAGKIGEILRVNTKIGSKKNISAHYDLSNDFFSLFLDPTMMYSSAIYRRHDDDLETAAVYKLDHICRRLNLSENDHLLEIGSGWGGMAIHAAQHYGCRVTTTTISNEQYCYALEKVKSAGLEDKVEVLKKDYRDLKGRYDKIVSIEMVEAVGYQFYDEFFAGCSRLLKEDGLMLMQAITTQDQRYEKEKNNSDFIRKYIFPGGCLPCNAVISEKIASVTDMHIVGIEDITLDYARTLADWRKRFFDKLDQVKGLGFDDVFIRMWDFYLCYCEGGFAERVINTSQFVFAKPRCFELPKVG